MATFNSNGNDDWVVPQGVSEIEITADGSSGQGTTGASGGDGGRVYANNVPVQAGETIQIRSHGGGNGGSSGGPGAANGGNGGNHCELKGTSSGLLVIAAGGGGAGGDEEQNGQGGGYGGDPSGENAGGGDYAGKGATQSSGGSGGQGVNSGGGGNDGSSQSGGNGGDGGSFEDPFDGTTDYGGGGGGGGSGYYGGGGGGGAGQQSGLGGGGGSSWATSSAGSVNYTGGYNSDGTSAIIQYQQPAPSDPTLNSATAQSDTQVDLSWSGDGTEDGYYVYRGTSSGSYSQIANVSSTTYSDTGLNAGTTYYYAIKAYNSGGTSGYSNERNDTTWDSPETPTLNSATADSGSQISINWSATPSWNGDSGHYDIYRNGSEVDSVSSGTTSYTDTGLNSGTTYDYQVRAENSVGGSSLSNTKSATTWSAPTAPQNVSATVDSNDQITVTWDPPSDWGGDAGNYRLNMRRDGTWGTEVTVGSGTTSYTYTAESDTAYEDSVGIDSKFDFAVRAENSVGNSSWSYSGDVYTDPIPPHNPSVSRPDVDTIEFSWSEQANLNYGTQVYYREDTGSGYGSWNYLNNSTSWNGSVSFSVSSNSYLSEDARYQFRLRHYRYSPNQPESYQWSDWVYADYGNSGNVFFEDDFESGDLSAWDRVNQDAFVDSDSGPDSGFSGADQGTYYCQLDSGGNIKYDLGDLRNESDVIVKCALAAGSMDADHESAEVLFYDGSNYRVAEEFHWEYNRQGWVEVTALIPDSWLNSNCWLKIRQTGGGGDYTYVDRVVVSDILHEYTSPAEPSNFSLDTPTEGDITASWTRNTSLSRGTEYIEYKKTSASSTTREANAISSPYSITGLLDGEAYDVQVATFFQQDRNGSVSTYWISSEIADAATTILPAPTGLSSPSHGFTSFDLSWTDNHNYGDTEVQYKKTSDGSWTTWSTLSRNTESETLTGLEEGERYDVRVVAKTEHETKVDT